MRVLVIYHAGFTYIPTIFHYLDAFRRHSLNKVEYYNIDQETECRLDFSGYDVLFVNFCVASVARIDPPPFFQALLPALRAFGGAKIIAVQDEYDFTNKVKRFLFDVGVDVLLTNVPQQAIERVYPEFAEDTHIETVLTAYLAEDLVAAPPGPPLAERDIVLGYRGRELPWRLGDLAWHKAEAGHRFRRACADRGIRHDIAVDEASRFQGNAWLQFIRRCRVMLGTPSGANVFDFDGQLHRRMVRRFKDQAGLTYDDVRDEVAVHEVGFDMGQVSARVFEAVAARTALAMIRGDYSGVVEPDEHYVPIEPDYSNVGAALDRILDVRAMQAMADRAYEHVIGNPANHYAGFIERVDRLASSVAQSKPRAMAKGDLRATPAPLGNDPYLGERLREAREDLKMSELRMKEIVRAAAENRLEVVLHHDGTYRALRFAQAS